MPVSPELQGRTYPPTAPVEITAERVGAFAAAVFATDPAVVPPTFAIVIQQTTLDQLLADPTAGIELTRVVHGEQRFLSERPIRIGDVLTGQVTVTGVRGLGPATMVTAETRILDADQTLVATATSVLVVGSDEAAA